MNHRLREHDYAGRGFYFVTTVTRPRRNLFSTISDYKTHLTQLGEIVRSEWLRLAREQPLLEQQEFEIMPDHFHGTIIATAHLPKPLGYYIGNFKGRTRQAIRKLLGDPAFPVWSRGFFDIVSLDADMFHAFRLYIKDNARRKQLRDENRHRQQQDLGLKRIRRRCPGNADQLRKLPFQQRPRQRDRGYTSR